MSTRKIYLLDTSVLLHRPDSLFSFGDNQVVIPIVVLDELDQFKKGSMELNRNARVVIKFLDDVSHQGPVSKGVKLDNGGTLTVDITHTVGELGALGLPTTNDNLILASAVGIKNKNPKKKVILVSKDINMRVKAEALGLASEDYRADQIIDIAELYSGQGELTVAPEVIDQVYEEREVSLDGLKLNGQQLAPNQFLMLKSTSSASVTALTRYDSDRRALVLLRELRYDVWGIRPLNREQRYAFEILLDDEIQLITLSGKAGTGKTILAIAAGLQKVVNEKTYRKLSIYRPVIPMGRDIGFLPGTEQEKLSPWMQPIMDNLEFLLNEHSGGGTGRKGGGAGRLDYLLDSNVLDIRALTYIRGRSLPQQFIVVDEAQNLTPHEVKTIITRAGEGTKLIFTGDPYQIDHPYLDSTSNGLTHVVEKFKEQSIAAHITLSKGERSPLAELASTLMEN
ncbi:MAG: phosphate starvation protein PhoH [Candidatus Xenobia bacterium]|jgi:PhoH-like ATPase